MGVLVSCNQWEGSTCIQGVLFYSFKFWGGGGAGEEEDFFHFPFVPTGFQCVPHGFSFKF